MGWLTGAVALLAQIGRLGRVLIEVLSVIPILIRTWREIRRRKRQEKKPDV